MFKYSIALQNKDEETYGIDNLELCDGVFGKPLYLLSWEEIEEIRNALIAKRQRIVLLILAPVINLEKCPAKGGRLTALPLKAEKTSCAPCRAILTF